MSRTATSALAVAAFAAAGGLGFLLTKEALKPSRPAGSSATAAAGASASAARAPLVNRAPSAPSGMTVGGAPSPSTAARASGAGPSGAASGGGATAPSAPAAPLRPPTVTASVPTADVETLAEKLHLDPEQRGRLHALFQEGAAMTERRLRELAQSGSADMNALQRVAEEEGKRMEAAIEAMLRPEQRPFLEEVKRAGASGASGAGAGK